MKVIKKWWKAITVAVASAVLSFTAIAGYAPTPATAEEGATAPVSQSLAVNNITASSPRTVIANEDDHTKDQDILAMTVDHYGARYLTSEAVLSSAQGNAAGKYAYYNVMKIHIGDQDFTDVTSWEIDTYTHLYTYANFWLVDSNGVVIRYNPSDATHKTGITVTHTSGDITSSSVGRWQGVQISKTGAATISMTKKAATDNLVLNPWTGEGVSSTANGTEFTWSSVSYMLVVVRSDTGDTRSYFDITDIRKVTSEGKTSVFDAQNSVLKDTLAEVTTQNDFAVGIPEYGNKDALLSAEVCKVKPGDLQQYMFGTGTKSPASQYDWFHAKVTSAASRETKIDLSSYDAFSFDIDSTALNNKDGFGFDLMLKTGTGAERRINGNCVHYVMDERNATHGYYMQDTNVYWFKPAMKARIIVPFSEISTLVEGDLTSMQAQIFFIFNRTSGNETSGIFINVSNIQFISNYESVIAPYQAIDKFEKNFTTHEGAQVRNTEPCGLRFGAQANLDDYNDLVTAFENAGVSYELGSIILPTDLVGQEGYEISPDNENLVVIPCVNGMVLNEEGGLMEYYGAIVGIQDHNLERDFTAYFYLTYTMNGVTNTILAKRTSAEEGAYDRSIYAVATKAIEAGKGTEYLQGIVDKVNASKEGN